MADPDDPQPPPPLPPPGSAEAPPGREPGRKRKRSPLGRPSGEDTWAKFGWVNAFCWLLLLVLGALYLLFWR